MTTVGLAGLAAVRDVFCAAWAVAEAAPTQQNTEHTNRAKLDIAYRNTGGFSEK
jgi:hypothetical protein